MRIFQEDCGPWRYLVIYVHPLETNKNKLNSKFVYPQTGTYR